MLCLMLVFAGLSHLRAVGYTMEKDVYYIPLSKFRFTHLYHHFSFYISFFKNFADWTPFFKYSCYICFFFFMTTHLFYSLLYHYQIFWLACNTSSLENFRNIVYISYLLLSRPSFILKITWLSSNSINSLITIYFYELFAGYLSLIGRLAYHDLVLN